jgi:hypothetical protein
MPNHRRRLLALIASAGAAPLHARSTPEKIDITELGARGDGRNDDAPAIQAAVERAQRSGGVVWIPASERPYLLGRPLHLQGPVTLRGESERARLLSRDASGIAVVESGAADITLDNLGLATAAATGAVLRVERRAVRLTVRNCRFSGPATHGAPENNGFLAVVESGEQFLIEGCTFEHLGSGIVLAGGVRGAVVARNTLRHWKNTGIQVRSHGDRGPEALRIEGNRLDSPLPGRVKYPIQLTRTGGPPIRDVRVTDNHIEGPRVPFDRTRNGSADQIALQGVVDFLVAGNVSVHGGENGIAISRTSSNGVVRANRVSFNFGHGICIGSGFAILVVDDPRGWSKGVKVRGLRSGADGTVERTLGPAVWVAPVTGGAFLPGEEVRIGTEVRKALEVQRGGNISVEDNECIGNGRHAGGKKGVFFGIFCQQVDDVTVVRNRCANEPGRSTQSYGLGLAHVARARVRDNVFRGNSAGEVRTMGATTVLP